MIANGCHRWTNPLVFNLEIGPILLFMQIHQFVLYHTRTNRINHSPNKIGESARQSPKTSWITRKILIGRQSFSR